MVLPANGVAELIREVRRLDPTSGVSAVLRVIAESARSAADVPFCALVPASREWSNGLITVAIDGYQGEPLVPDDAEPHIRIADLAMEVTSSDATMWRFPIQVNGQEFALLYLAGIQDPGLIDERMSDFVGVAGIVIERAILAEEVNSLADWPKVFGPLPESTSPSIPRATSFFEDLAETARRLTDTECAAIATPAGSYIEVRAATGFHAERLRGSVVPAELSLMGQVIATVEMSTVQDAASSELTYGPTAKRVDLGSVVVIPLRWLDQPIGALMLGNQRGSGDIDVEKVLHSLSADPRLRRALGLERRQREEFAVPLLRLKGAPEWDWRFNLLAQRELVVLSLLGEGLSNAEIAQRLFLSDKTVRNYVSNTLTKLGMRRVEAAVLAARLLAALPEQEAS